MKNLFLLLLLANILFAAWRLWIAAPELPSRQLPGTAAGDVAPLVALPRSAARSSASPAGGGPGQAGSGGACVRVGPLRDIRAAELLRGRLADRGLDAGVEREEGQVRVGYEVRIEGIASRADAEQAMARLAAAGMDDARLSEGMPPLRIALGVLADREQAERVQAVAKALGFEPRLSDRYRPATRYWVAVTGLPGGELPGLAAFEEEIGQFLQVEPVACPVAPVGGGVAIH